MPLLGLSPVLWEPSQGTTQLAQDFAKQYLSIPQARRISVLEDGHLWSISMSSDIGWCRKSHNNARNLTEC